jgi:hypothetical protein
VALHGSRFLALTFLGGLFVEFAASQLGQYSCLFASTLEAPQGGIEILVFSNPNARHKTSLNPKPVNGLHNPNS